MVFGFDSHSSRYSFSAGTKSIFHNIGLNFFHLNSGYFHSQDSYKQFHCQPLYLIPSPPLHYYQHFALTNLLNSPPTSKHLSNPPTQPLPWHTHPAPIAITNPSHKDRISRRDFLFRWRHRVVSTILSGDFRCGDFATAFGSLFFEEAIYCVHLLGTLAWTIGPVVRGREECIWDSEGKCGREKKGDWVMARVIVVMGLRSVRETRRTFSSSLRFSLRFLRRRAISARRMACSSAVRCFFV